MKIYSIRGFFYRMFNLNYLLVLVPLVGFIYTYIMYRWKGLAPFINEEETFLLQVALSGITLFNLAAMQIYSVYRLRRIRRELSLGKRLESYFDLNITRFVTGSINATLVAGGFYLTLSQFFGAALLIVLVWMTWQWPLARKVCDDLHLRGDELQVVLNKQDKLP